MRSIIITKKFGMTICLKTYHWKPQLHWLLPRCLLQYSDCCHWVQMELSLLLLQAMVPWLHHQLVLSPVAMGTVPEKLDLLRA